MKETETKKKFRKNKNKNNKGSELWKLKLDLRAASKV